MRRILLAFALVVAPVVFAQHGATDAPPAGAENAAHSTEKAHGEEAGGHAEKTYFGIPGWILKVANMALFLGILIYFVGGPVKKAFAERSEAIRVAAQEARERHDKAERMAGDIQARLDAIEQEVRAIHERALREGEKQKQELIAAAEAEAQKIRHTARNEVDNRLKHARAELLEYAGQLVSERARGILADKITDADQRKLFDESLREVGEVRS